MIEGTLKMMNWNVAGGKYLELKSEQSNQLKEHNKGKTSREEFRKRLNIALKDLVDRHQPAIIALHEVAEYDPGGNPNNAENVIDEISGYDYYPLWLIDTQRHSHQGKWNKVRKSGEWPDSAYLAQGNGIMLLQSMKHFPIWSLPALGQDHNSGRWLPDGEPLDRGHLLAHAGIEMVALESGLYFGNRDTEPRAAMVVHFVLEEVNGQALKYPLDVFVVNLHLTTLMMEREGIPDIDEKAAQVRLRQLEIVLDGIVARYNRWRAEGFLIRGDHVVPKEDQDHRETHQRYSPVWILAGDFNFTPQSVEYDTLVRRAFIDLIPFHSVGTKTSGLGQDPTLTVDYIFAGPRFEAIEPRIAETRIQGNHVEVNGRTRVSDHFPLIVDVPITLPDKPRECPHCRV